MSDAKGGKPVRWTRADRRLARNRDRERRGTARKELDSEPRLDRERLQPERTRPRNPEPRRRTPRRQAK